MPADVMPDAAVVPGRKLAPPPRAGTWVDRVKHLAATAVPRSMLVRRGATTERRVALTFDDGPHEMTEAYLDVLDRFGARATFFVVGQKCVERRETLLRILSRGHELAAHGFSHRPFPKMDAATLAEELRQTAALLPPVRAARALVRPPFGGVSLPSLARCALAGFTTVLWSRDSDDCRTTSAAEVAARLTPAVLAPGDIVLMHEGQDWTLAALPRILDALATGGWQAVSVGEILNPQGA